MIQQAAPLIPGRYASTCRPAGCRDGAPRRPPSCSQLRCSSGRSCPAANMNTAPTNWDDESPSVAARPPTDAALPRDPHLNEPVSGAELDAWVHNVLPDTQGQVFHTGFGTLEADEETERHHNPAAQRYLRPDPGVPERPPGVLFHRERRERTRGPESPVRDVQGERGASGRRCVALDQSGCERTGELCVPGEPDLKVPGRQGSRTAAKAGPAGQFSPN